MANRTLLIVGLGNPGEKYAHTRHNAGFEVMDRLEAYYGVKLRKKLLLQGMTAEVTDGETKVVLCEPLTFMNRSGDCVRKLLNRFKVPQENLLEEIIGLIKQYDFTGQRRVSFEYTVFSGWNHSPRHADALLRLLRGLECRVNLIRFHAIPDFPYKPAAAQQMELFRDRLEKGGITATIRASRGEDIFAACGLLAGKHNIV